MSDAATDHTDHRRRRGLGRGRHDVAAGGRACRRRRAALLLPPRNPEPSGAVPHVPGGDRRTAEAPAVLRPSGRRRDGGPHDERDGRDGPQVGHRVPAPEPPAGLSDLRRSRAVHAPGLCLRDGSARSRYAEAKLVLGRDRVADDILYFGDRCIVCTRCVRFMEDVAGDNALLVAQRGHKAYIDTFPGKDLDHAFRGNIVDVCPVGAGARGLRVQGQGVGHGLVARHLLRVLDRLQRRRQRQGEPGRSDQAEVEPGREFLLDVRPWPAQPRHGEPRRAGRGSDGPSGGELEPASWSEALAWVARDLDDARGIAVVSAGARTRLSSTRARCWIASGSRAARSRSSRATRPP